MAKQDVLDAINATIVENGQKGITAQALNNVLTMMTENAGEGGGSGDGVLRIMVPDELFFAPVCFGSSAVGDGFTPETWALVQSELESVISSADMGESEKELYETYLTSMNEIVPAMFTHNAKVYTELMAKAKSKEGVMVLLDQSISYAPAFRLTSMMPIDVDVSLSCPAISAILNIPGESREPEGVMLTSVVDDDDTLYNRNSGFFLNPDGSIVLDAFTPSYIYVPSTTNSEGFLNDVEKAHNLAFYNSGVHSMYLDYVALVDETGGSYIISGPKIILYENSGNVRYFEGLELKQAAVNGDGSVTVTTLGTISTSEGSGNEILKVWLDGAMGGELTEEQIAENVSVYTRLIGGEYVNVLLCGTTPDDTGTGTAVYYPTSQSALPFSEACIFGVTSSYLNPTDNSIVIINMAIVLSSDGSVTVTTNSTANS